MIDDGTNHDLPDRMALCDAFGTAVSEDVYRSYYRPMFERLRSLADSEVTSQDELYETIEKDVREATKKKRLKCLLSAQPTLIEAVADAPPTANTFVTYCANRLGFDRTGIDSESLNDVQGECVRAGEEMRTRHLDYHVGRLRDEAERRAGIEVPETGRIAVAEYRQVMHSLVELVGDKLPDELQSFDQRMVGIAGRANELIAVETLLSAGLDRETAFENVASGSEEEDIRVQTLAENGDPFHVEVKSTGVRERSDAGASRIEDPAAIFGFFDDAAEVRGRAAAIAKHAAVTYLPPTTLAAVRSLDSAVYERRNAEGELFLRANNVFPADMRAYHETGTLPERTPGHERAYIE